MTTIATLDFSRIRSEELPLPDFVVAQFSPFGKDETGPFPTQSVVLDLTDAASLARETPVPAGPGRLDIRCPNGEFFSQHVEVADHGALRGSLAFKVKLEGTAGHQPQVPHPLLQLQSSTHVLDRKFLALLDFIQQGDLEASVAMILDAQDPLYEHRGNAFVSVAAGYVLLHTPLSKWPAEWREVVFNLTAQFPQASDGPVLIATILLQCAEDCRAQVPSRDAQGQNDLELALNAVLEAVRRGPPLVRMGLRMMHTNIAILKGEFAKDREVLKRLEEAETAIHRLRLQVDPHLPITVFENLKAAA